MPEMAAALDREYGWFGPADRGKSEQAAMDLSRSDERLARLLFDPGLYALGSNGPSQTGAAPSGALVPPDLPPSRIAPESRMVSPVNSAPKTPAAEPVRPAPANVAALIQPTPALVLTPPALSRPTVSTIPEVRAAAGSEPAPVLSKPPAGHDTRPINLETPVKSLPEKFAIQVFASRNKEAAEEQAERIRNAGLVPLVQPVDLKGKGLWYRVRLPGFPSRATANAAGKHLLSAKLGAAYWLIPA
jgi:hypothetical protein